jgi:drug/metabolite transporter (DMT)-like permease
MHPNVALDAYHQDPYGLDMRTAAPLVIVIVASVVYHLAQKSAGAASPWVMLAIAYGLAFALALGLALASGAPARWTPARGEWIGGAAVGLAAFGIEAGFFFLYRSGAPLASVSVIASSAVTVVLALVGITLFGEPLSTTRAAGILLAGGAATLIAQG